MKIALIIGGISFDSQKQLATGIAETAQLYGDCVISYDSNGKLYIDKLFEEDEISDFRIMDLVDVSRFDGVIIAQNTIVNKDALDDILNKVRESGVPAVCVDAKQARFSSIETDHRKSMQLIVDHLIECHNIHKFCFVSGPGTNRDSELRLEGFKDSLLGHFERIPDYSIVYGNYNAKDAQRKIAQFLQQTKDLPEAFVCANDDMAMGVCCALRERGLRVPEDILVTGFDGAQSAEYFSPQITTARRKQKEIGQTAVHMLHRGLEQYPKYQCITADILHRMSCSCVSEFPLNYENLLYKYQLERMNQSEKNMFVLIQQQNIIKAESYKELKNILLRYIGCINPRKCFICLCNRTYDVEVSSEFIDMSQKIKMEMNCYSEKMTLFIGYDSQKDEIIRSNELFDPRDLLPESIMSTLSGECLHVFSLQGKDKCFGYVVLSNEDVVEQYDLYSGWVSQVAIALECLTEKKFLFKVVDRLNNLWGYDSLTGLYNRAGFKHEAMYMIDDSIRRRERLTIIFFDMNSLKKINDEYGHDEGDFAICSLAQVLKKMRRPGDLLVRYGGDEFLVLSTLQTENAIEQLILEAGKNLQEIKEREKKEYPLAASAGYVTELFHSQDDLDIFINQADKNMYISKKEAKLKAEK